MKLARNFSGRFELCVVVKRDVEKFLFDMMTNLPLCGGRDRVPSLSEELHMKEHCQPYQTKNGVEQSVTFQTRRES